MESNEKPAVVIDGLSDRELQLLIYHDVSQMRGDFQTHQVFTQKELGRRPSRGELYSLFGVAGVLSGVIFNLLA